MSYVLGLDFGTSFTAAAAADPNGRSARVVTLGNRAAAVPSVVFVRPDGSLLAGEDAYLRGASEPTRLVRNLKRRLGDRSPIVLGGATSYGGAANGLGGPGGEGASFAPEELVAGYLRWVIGRVAEREGGTPQRLVLTHPANWRSLRLDAYRRAAAAAGLDGALFVTEPYAAAAFHAAVHPLPAGAVVAAYDLGGGTFDAAVLRQGGATGSEGFELAGEPEGVEHLGGVDVDDVVLHLVRTKLGAAWAEAERAGGPAFATSTSGLLRECTAAKEALSSEPEVEVPVVLPGLNRSVVVTRSELEQLIGPAVAETIGAFRRAVAAAGTRPGDLDAVLLVGGSSRIPLVGAAVAREVGPSVPILDADPRHAVARGAALLAAGATAATSAPLASPAEPAAPVAPVAPVALAAAAPTAAPALPPTDQPAAPPPANRPEVGEPVVLEAAGAQPARRRRAPLVVLAVLGVLAGVAGVLVIARSSDNGGSSGSLAAGAATSTSASGSGLGGAAAPSGPTTGSTAPAVVASGVGMVAVPAGAYPVGSATPGAEAAAARTVTLVAFHIDALEVVNADYDRFVQTQGAPAARSWPLGRLPEDKADHPVTGVEWGWAQAYCVSLGKRLPHDAEWEAAARGPAGSTYPWGEQADAVDLDTPGSRPAGSTASNVSTFGVRDTVGSAWEWVDEPYEPVPDGQVVRRGGEYGRVRGGAAMRQVVNSGNPSAITETGFRCAADQVDPNRAPGEFSDSHPHPDEAVRSTTTAVPSGPTAVLIDDSFEDTKSGWPDRSGPGWKVGYHAPTWYHVEAGAPGAQVMSLGGYDWTNASVEAAAYVDKVGNPAGSYRYGLVFRAEGAQRAPDSGAGNDRPENFYAFVIDPGGKRWQLLHDDTLPLRSLQEGPLPAGVRVTDGAAPDRLKVDMRGDQMTLFVNGQPVGEFDTHGYHTTGDLGLYVESIDDAKPHVHFDELKVTPI